MLTGPSKKHTPSVKQLTKSSSLSVLYREVNEFIANETNVIHYPVSDSRVEDFRNLDRLLKSKNNSISSHFENAVYYFCIAKLHEKCKTTYHKQANVSENDRVNIYVDYYLKALKSRDCVKSLTLDELKLLDHVIYFIAGQALVNQREKWNKLEDIPSSLHHYLTLEKKHEDYAKQQSDAYKASFKASLTTPLKYIGKAAGVAAGIYLTGGLSFSLATLFGSAVGFYAGSKSGEKMSEILTEKCHRP